MIRSANVGSYVQVLPGAGSLGNIGSSDLGKLLTESSGKAVLQSSTSTSIPKILGMVANVPVDTTGGSTVPFYVWDVRGKEIEQTYTTLASATLPATTDIGSYVGWSTASTGAAGGIIGMDTASSAPGKAFLKITGFDNNRRKVFGRVNTTNLAL
jgi:hypothetical protein